MTTFQYNQTPQKLFSFNTESIERESNSIHFHAGDDAILSIKEDGFYVRGVRVEQDADEARKVYDSFTQWLSWAHLNKV